MADDGHNHDKGEAGGSHGNRRSLLRPRLGSFGGGGGGEKQMTLPRDPDALLEGWLKKRGTRIQSLWSERFFVLKGDQLFYYLKPTDADARGVYILDRNCVVSEVKPYTTAYDKKKVLHAFRVLWPEGIETTEQAGGDGKGGAETENKEGGGTDGSAAGSSRNEGKESGVGRSSSMMTASTSSHHEVTPPNPPKSTRGQGVEGVDVVMQRRAQTPDRSFADMAPDPYVQGYIPATPVPTATKVVRSVNSLQRTDSSGRRLNTRNSSQRNTTTLATGGAMVAMAVGGVVVGALTAGVGLVAPMIVVGVTAAAGSGATVYGASSGSHSVKPKQIALVLALENKESAEEWRAAIEAQVRWSQGFPQSRWMSMVGLDRRIPNSFKRRGVAKGPTAATKLDDVDKWTRSTRWKPWSVYNGIRVYELDHIGGGPAGTNKQAPHQGRLPCRKIQVAVRGTPLETFIALVSIPCRVSNGVVDSLRIIERLDDQSDVIHMTLKPLYLWPTWTAPRDFCLVRYWRYDEDGTYIICLDSTTHRACPPVAGHVRAGMHAVYTISPKKHLRNVEFDDAPECLLTYILQVNPRGWVWHNFGYLDSFVSEMMLQVLDIRDLLETDRFMAVHVDTNEEHRGAGKEIEPKGPSSSTMETHRATIPPEMWAEVDASTFVVRGPGYSNSKLKVPSEKSAFRLLSVDLFDLAEPIDNIASHPNNRVQAAIKKGDAPPLIFVVQLQFPGAERQLGYVSYFAPEDMSVFEDDTPLSRVVRPFFFGDDDSYRDNRFKLIPKIVEGNWVVRKSVGSTPAILGTKLKQHYYKGPNNQYFELDVNISSSSVAAGVVRLAAGYAKTLVVDLALVIQGEEENELPERVVACWRIKFMDLSIAKKLVDD